MKAKHILMMAAVLLLDQLSKWGVQTSMQIDESFDVIPGFFRITYLHNTGAAWSMLEGKMVFFYLISIVFLIGMLYFYRTTDHRDRLTRIGVVLMMAGTLGNFIDRLISSMFVIFWISLSSDMIFRYSTSLTYHFVSV